MVVSKVESSGANNSVLKACKIMDVLFRNFFHGYSASELAEATGLGRSDITRYVQTLETAGWAERIPETGRIRPSHKVAQSAVQVMNELESAEARVVESKQRLSRIR